MTTVPVDDSIILAAVDAQISLHSTADPAVRDAFLESIIDKEQLVSFATQMAWEQLQIEGPEDLEGRSVEFKLAMESFLHGALVGILYARRRTELTALNDDLVDPLLNARFDSKITVELIKTDASDQMVVNAARVSVQGDDVEAAEALGGNRGLINFLMKNRHGSPFEHIGFTWLVTAPIFVWREHMRHRIASYNEESGRYTVLKPHFYVPGTYRPLQQIGKAGAYEFVEGTAEQVAIVHEETRIQSIEAYKAYTKMLDAGVAKEVARMVLPVNIMSSAYVTMNARALMNFLSLRTKHEDSTYPSYPQEEIAMVGRAYEADFAQFLPITAHAWHDHGRVAP